MSTAACIRVIFMLLLVVGFVRPVRAAEFAYLHGSVIDANNNPVARAEVTLDERTFKTKDDGKFYFDRLTPGNHVLRVDSNGKSTQETVVLEPGRYSERVVIFGAAARRVRFTNARGVANEILPNVGINSYASISPKDGTLAVEVLSAQTQRFDIWHLERDGRKLGVLVATEDDDENPRWSPDGGSLAFHRRSGLRGYEVWVKNLRTGALQFVDSGLTPAWSPDGRSVVYAKSVHGNWDIYVKNLESGRVMRLTKDASRQQYPYWAKLGDEEQIVFASKRTGTYEIWVMGPDGSHQRRLSTVGQRTGNRMVGPVVAPDGQKIAFWEIDYEDDHSVWLMNPDGSGQRELVRRAANPEWDPRAIGKRAVYFDSKITGRAQVWRTVVVE